MSKITVDLHGIRHGNVEKLLEKRLLNGKKDYLRTEIITGNSDRMREIVHDFLDEHDFKYVVTEYNMGRTVIIGQNNPEQPRIGETK